MDETTINALMGSRLFKFNAEDTCRNVFAYLSPFCWPPDKISNFIIPTVLSSDKFGKPFQWLHMTHSYSYHNNTKFHLYAQQLLLLVV